MIDKFKISFDWLTGIHPIFLATVLAILGILLFSPEGIAKSLAIYEFRENYKIYLGPALVVVTSLGFARVVFFFNKKMDINRSKKIRNQLPHQLTPEEKGYLYSYIFEEENTLYVALDDGVMGGLLAKKITYRASRSGNLLDGFPCNLQQWARNYLEQRPWLLDDRKGRPMTPREKLRLR